MSLKTNFPSIALWFILVSMLSTMVIYHHWTRSKPAERGVIHWDVISYYSYLPATFIYGDVTLGFLDDPEFNNDNKFWPVELENGKHLILTSMGLSILYSPFFFMAHWIAPLTGHAQDGFNSTYQLFLMLSSLFWVMMGLLVIRRILLRYFTPISTGLTLVLVGLGTNLFFYTVHEGPMSHGYNFAFITFFLSLVIRWYEAPSYRKSILLGLVYGLIVLIRPTNILVGILLAGWGISSMATLKKRPHYLFKHWKHLLLMFSMFLIPWIPQMIYWKVLTGSFMFNSYGSSGSSFYLDSPHIFHLLFSFRKGWYLYTPLMLVATFGLFFLGRQCKGAVWPITAYLSIQVYVLASWWSWWTGGSFGLRSFVDLYGLMALPLAAIVERSLDRRRIVKWATGVFLLFLLYMNQYQTIQYHQGIIHHTGMTREAYKLNFLSFKPDGSSWNMLSLPDAQLARLGIYYSYYTGDDQTALKSMAREEALSLVQDQVESDRKLMKEIKNHARRNDISVDEALEMVVQRVYEQKTAT